MANTESPKARLEGGMDAIAAVDDDVARALAVVGYPQPRVRPAGIETFVSIIVGQQISTHAARAILNRLRELVPEWTADALLSCGEEQLRGVGLSRRKFEYITGLAKQIVAGEFDPDALANLDDEAVIAQITALRGFGRWSAEIYLMFSLQRPDVLPADDLALQTAMQRLKRLPDRPTGKQTRELAAHWQPHRSAGSLFLWHYYRGEPA